MKRLIQYALLFALQFVIFNTTLRAQKQQEKNNPGVFKIDLSGVWMFQTDSLDKGLSEQWFTKRLKDKIRLPGSMTTNGKGNDITVNTPWTGQIIDSSWFFLPEYAQYRKPGNIKIPFWLQAVKYYKGAAWYQTKVIIPSSWKKKYLELFIERSHWETTLWIDDKLIGLQNSLAAAHVFDLTKSLLPGTHYITIRVDNRVKDFNPGQNSHSISDHTQTNWNGMIGKLYIAARPLLNIDDVQLYPDIYKRQVAIHLKIRNITGSAARATLQLNVISDNSSKEKLKMLSQNIEVKGDSADFEIVYPMGKHPLLWNEFHPNLYSLKAKLIQDKNSVDTVSANFGMRNFSTEGTQFIINDSLTFLRGTLECAVFPKTGYPPTDLNSWLRIFKIAKSYGLNHMRFHSWCPPEAAFDAADRSGFYLQIECSSWANQGAAIGDGLPLDQYIYQESQRIVKSYGNHPSFCMLAYGNEPAGKNYQQYLTEFVKFWKEKDSRRLYTTAAGWPVVPENNYNSTPAPRIQLWLAGLKSIINSQPPKSDYDWSAIIAKWQHPTVSHEIGQWCAYPDFKEISKYTGVLKAKNFEIFKDKLQQNGMAHLADSFLLASGKLQALCYKADIEAALRTPGFGGFQLLSLYDFPGQGTALVGVLNSFWESKGYITSKEYSRFCNAVVPLARLPKMVYYNNEELSVPVEIANFGQAQLNSITPSWEIKNASGKILFKGQLSKLDIPLGNSIKLGSINQTLSSVTNPEMLTLSVSAGNYKNTWEFFVYPFSLPNVENILVTSQLDNEALKALQQGNNVLLTLKKGDVKATKGGAIQIGFSSIFWNTAWTGGQPPTTLGILVNPAHPALKYFPTQYYSNWQWWDAMSHSNAILLDSVANGLQPIVRVIDDWVTARSIGLVFECSVGKGKLIVCGIDLLSNQDKRPEAKQLLYSLKRYMSSNQFNPQSQIDIDKIKSLLNE